MKILNIAISKLFSIVFRVILLVFGIFIVSTHNNVFADYIYVLVFSTYFLIFISLLLREGLLSELRLFNDFVLIAFTLYGKNIDFLATSFLVLPILNSPNHSEKKKSVCLYFFLIITFLYLLNFKSYTEVFFIACVFWLMNFLVNSKQNYYKNISHLNEVIEKFLSSSLELRKSYRIYNGLIDKLNDIRAIFLYRPIFDNIICYKIIGKKAILVNSSKFVWSINVTVLNVDVFKQEDGLFRNGSVMLNINDETNNNFIVPVKTNSQQYVFVLLLSDVVKSNDLFNLYYINILKPIFSRISRVIDLENSLKDQNRKILDDYRNKYFYVQNAEKAMHFIKNRFNSLDNFIEMSKDNIDDKMDKEELLMYKKELSNVERNYNLLIDRVKTILNKSDKPFSATNLEFKSVDYLFDTIRNIWFDYFQDFEYALSWNVHALDGISIQINTDGLYILMTDWINNVKKYSTGAEIVIFAESDSSLEVVFQNSFSKNSLQIVEELKNDFNSSEKDKILQRTSHGVLIMKSLMEEMGLSGNIKVVDLTVSLNLSFKKYINEDSNI